MGSYGLLDFVFVFRSTSKVSWSLIESHWVSWFNDCQSWGVGAIFEHLRVWSTPCVSAPCWVGSSSLGHPRHAYVTVVWSCAVPMCRLCCLRCAFEWNGRRMSTACALLKHWRCGQVEVATVYGPVWNLGSQRNLGFRVSDGFCFGWFLCILTVFVFVGPVMPHAQIWYCRAWGSLWWFGEVVIFCLAMMRRDSERSRRFSSVFCLFCLLLKCGGELQALAMPICIAGPKVGGVSGPTSCTCCLPQEEEGFGGLIFHSSFATRLCICYSRSYIFWGSWRYRLPSFLMCFWCLRNVSVAYALRIHGSSCPEVPAYTTFQAWSWDNFLPWTNQFETNQIPKRVMKNHGRTWVSEYGSQDLDWAFFCWSGCFHQRFSRPPQVQLNYAFDKLPWWSLRTTGSLADASYAERSAWCRTCWPIAAHRQWTRQRSGKVKTTLPVTWWYSGTATQHWTFHGIAYIL